MVVFSDRPVTKLDDLFGRGHREAVERLRSAVEEGYFIAVLGARRVGKTSVVKTFLNHYRYRFLYFDLSPYIGLRAVSLHSLVPAEVGFNESSISSEAQLSLAVVSFRLKRLKITSEVFQSNLVTLLQELSKRFRRFVLVFDEAQVLPFIKGINYRGLLQLIHNNYHNISVVLTGSMPGLLERVVSPANASMPGFARYIEEIEVPKWSREEAVEFLKQGLRERGIAYIEEELEAAYEELSGVPGFITYYGLLRTRGYNHEEALAKASEYATTLWERDLKAFIQIYNSPLYIHTLAALAETITGASWSEIMKELEMRTGKPVSKSTLHRIINNLLRAAMIQKKANKYIIIDRPLKRAVKKLARTL